MVTARFFCGKTETPGEQTGPVGAPRQQQGKEQNASLLAASGILPQSHTPSPGGPSRKVLPYTEPPHSVAALVRSFSSMHLSVLSHLFPPSAQCLWLSPLSPAQTSIHLQHPGMRADCNLKQPNKTRPLASLPLPVEIVTFLNLLKYSTVTANTSLAALLV